MKRLALVACIFAARTAGADSLSLSASADGPDDRATDVARLVLRDSVTLTHHGATAAFSVDPSIIEVSARNGQVTLIARAVGMTTVSIVTGKDIVSLPITVIAPESRTIAEPELAASRRYTQWQGQYETSTSRLTNSLEMIDANEERTYRAYAVNVVRTDEILPGDIDARSSLPALSVEWRTKRHEVVAFDKAIESSPLTLDGTVVRGAHVRSGGLRLHAGITSPVLYQNVFLSRQGETVFGASYEIKAGRRSWLMPNLYAFPTEPQTGGTSGTMGSLLYRYRSPADRLQLRGEVGWGGRLGAAGELTYQDPYNRAWVTARHQPRGFAALGIGRPLGSSFEGMYTAEPSKTLTINVATTAARYQTGTADQDLVTSLIDMRSKLTRRLVLSTGIASGQFRGDATMGMVHSMTASTGLHVEGARGGVSALYRYQTNTARNLGGHGGRFSARISGGDFHASSFLDVQQEAATLELVLREEPALAQALADLGLTASTPDDLARLLRENATLSGLGYSEGARLDFNPWRAQLGGDLAWRTTDKTRRQLRLRVLANTTQTVGERNDTISAALSYSQRLGKNVEVGGIATYWSRTQAMAFAPDTWTFAASARVRLDTVPRLGGFRERELGGVVVAEDGSPVAGVRVRLDARRVATTDARGRFQFASVAGGSHRVEAQLPEAAYFVSSSSVIAEAGEPVRFVIARAHARLVGYVRDDAGRGLAGIVVRIHGHGREHTQTTDSSGRFKLALDDGDYTVETVAESIPVGYDLTTLAPQSMRVDARSPSSLELLVRGNRSIAGTVAPGSVVRLLELDLTAELDADGSYVFRGLPPGRFTLETTTSGKRQKRIVQLPAEPTALVVP